MEVILLERIERLGIIGDVVKVKPGFARNFLLPQNKALRATKENMAYFESQKAQLEANNLKLLEEAKKVSTKIEGTVLTVIRQAGSGGQLYGSVTPKDIVVAMGQDKITIEARQVRLHQPIKMLGVHSLTVAIHPEVTVDIRVNVAKSEEEAVAQLKDADAPKVEERTSRSYDKVVQTVEADTAEASSEEA